MNSKIKKILAVLLSAVMVMSVAFISTAAGPRYERPELNKADTVKTTGTWSKDANGFWSLTSDNKKVSGGWYYANMQNSSTEYRWYHFDEKGIMSTGWVKDRIDPSIWYYTGEAKDATEGGMVTGWVTDPQDGQKYYMDPATGQMSHGWVKIDNSWYYFCQSQYANRNWTPDQTGYWTASKQTGHSFGSMYKNEMTPDGYYVDGTGAWRQSSGSSGNSTRRNPDPTPIPDPVMRATASTTTPQYAGKQFDPTGLKITVFKDGAECAIVTLPDERIPADGIKVTVNDVVDGTLSSGSNEVKIEFVYSDPNVIIGQSITTEVFTVDGITYTVTFDRNGHGTAPDPTTNVTHGSTITAPTPAPTETGWTFGGWYKESGCTNAWNFANDTVTADITLYAKWTSAAKPFTVDSSGTTVEFSHGLLYANASDPSNITYGFEDDQVTFTDPYSTGTYDKSHLNYFYWSKDASVAVAETYSDPGVAPTDTFFTEQSGFTVNGEPGWRTLSYSEWSYLINTRKINGGTTSGFGETCMWGTYPGTDPEVKGLFIAHDNYSGGFTGDNWESTAIADGCVFLPAAGSRYGTGMGLVGSVGFYWSSPPDEGDEDGAYDLYFDDGGARTGYSRRGSGRCVRLVREVRTASSPFQPNIRDKYTLPPRGFHQKPQAAAENYEKQ